MNHDFIWQTKLAARIHDPAEKALVLLRDPAGHENGTSRALRRLLGFEDLRGHIDPDNDDVLSTVLFKKGIPADMYRHVQRADWWAAAADRPQWPMQEITVTTRKGEQKTFKVAECAQVRWTKSPVLIHPLTGEQFDLAKSGGLRDTDIADIKQRSFEHFSQLLKLGANDEGSARDWRKILLSYWRFGPELTEDEDNGKLGELWKLLPADTRVPDHSIWDHLDLTSAFAGAFAADPKGEVALLTVSLGPVQSFIAAARTTSDLWAGSHLLSRLVWKALRPLCERLGPDAILFPRLRGIPQVDLWLRDQMQLPHQLFAACEWMKGGTDANPLFAAALPNRFVAVVPASEAKALAEQAGKAVRDSLQALGRDVVGRLLKEAGFDDEGNDTPYAQMREQLAGFPEVHWAVVPFSLIRPRNTAKQTELDPSALSSSMAPFFGAEAGKPCGFLDTPAWQVLQKEIDWGDGTAFFAPNPGVLYPAVYELAERMLAAAKSLRAFDQQAQEGWRDSLSGEAEWLTTDRDQLQLPPGQRQDTLWTRIAAAQPSWAKKGEHLGALAAVKRLWPTIFADKVGKEHGEKKDKPPFVVSTHTMALARQLDQWLKNGGKAAPGFEQACMDRKAGSVALPRKLIREHGGKPALALAKCLPGLLEAARDAEDEGALERTQKLVKETLRTALGEDETKLETYYALLMMDGDRMGRILSGTDAKTAISYRDSFHPQVQKGFDDHAALQAFVKKYGEQKRPISPNRHLAISGALNDFSQVVARHVVEEEHFGRLIYAGGDDVLAMLPVADLLPCMQRLRHAYSGTVPEDEAVDWSQLRGRKTLICKQGYAWLNGRLMRMMGEQATASTGAVIAHHQAPLSAVLRELRAAEKRAKTEGGWNAFSITVIKRSGGALQLTAQWGEPLRLLTDLRDFLADADTSRSAVYHSLQWLKDLPDPRFEPEMLRALLAYQLQRQSGGKARADAPELASRLTELAKQAIPDGRDWLQNFMSVAEFLARETRSGGEQ